MKESYTNAVLQLLRDAKDVKQANEVLAGLKKTLDVRGHGRLLPSVLRSVARRLRAGRLDGPELTLARDDESEFAKLKADIARASHELSGATPIGSFEDVTVREEPSIIGGFRLKIGDRLADQSYKLQLLDLYRNITTK